jgi:hypothetical protein
MGIQSSHSQFIGNIGKLNYYKTKGGYMVREKGGVTKERIMTDPRYGRTRENMAEFGDASYASKCIYSAFHIARKRAASGDLYSRMNKLMVHAVKSEPIHSRGERRIADAPLELLCGLQFNKQNHLNRAIRAPYYSEITEELLTFSIPELLPAQDLKYPPNTTHFRFFGQAVSTDMGKKENYDEYLAETDFFPLELPLSGFEVSLELSPLKYAYQACMVGVEFFQFTCGHYYPVARGNWNAGEIVGAVKKDNLAIDDPQVGEG